MTNDQKKQLETQLWNIADQLRGKMNADEFRDYWLGFIFYKYLSERQYLYANEILAEDEIDFLEIDEGDEEGQEYARISGYVNWQQPEIMALVKWVLKTSVLNY